MNYKIYSKLIENSGHVYCVPLFYWCARRAHVLTSVSLESTRQWEGYS